MIMKMWRLFGYIALFSSVSGLSSSFRGLREWKKNTNFGNVDNWEGWIDLNCSKNIFSFPEWMEAEVIAWPSTFIGSQIILPVNGHLVFDTGINTLSGDQGKCQQGREMKFRRTSRADWLNQDNWKVKGMENGFGENAIPHVEKVPCQFDTVQFPAKSTFSLKISQNVVINQFYLGDELKSYTDIAIMMNSQLGNLQFQKEPEVQFILTNDNCKDEDSCVCDNYKTNIKQKICSVSQCRSVEEDECHNPILPHGFCCSICGFHVKIKHSGTLKLEAIARKLESLIPSQSNPKTFTNYFISRHSPKNAHVIIVPGSGQNGTEAAMGFLAKAVDFIKKQPQVESVNWIGSWGHVPSDVDKWTEDQGVGGGTVAFLVILAIIALVGIFCFIFYKKNGSYPAISLTTVSNLIPSNFLSMPSVRVPSMAMPNIGLSFPNLVRRRSTQAGGRTFGFARFTNERVSTVNIEHSANSSGIERGEPVDESIQRIDSSEKVTQVSPDTGFVNLLPCDIVGVGATESPLDLETLQKNTDSFMEADATSGNEQKTSEIPGPAKPARTLASKVSPTQEILMEPIYNEVADRLIDTTDSSAILIPEDEDTEE